MARTKSDRTRTQIIEGAIRALSEAGVAGITTRKIAAESGVELSTLHYHFDSKSALLFAVLEALIEEMVSWQRAHLESVTDINECIDQLLQVVWRMLMSTRPLQLIQYELTLYALREDADWLAERQYDAYVQPYVEFLRKIPEREGGLSLEECRTIARFMLAGMDGLLLQELAKPNRARSKRGVEALIAATQTYANALRRRRG
ncbi:AcrR family transcriptional regulator [Bradyrhizobium sp. USDA 4524]|uniref:TetR/AcrR family transcriptional regulator n=1 Tax=unclassified Bradyrhizobium TaxID=2631580 RepID=UPI0020A12E9C|nr:MULTISPECIES: TetR/AcrR family transcriptional regulator [unclassified Bradyrhizobium]MCP1845818.1 AcrR family transcriptional regulator [Bradyrhizobium sp. USDA 4538]MCP1906859.1 AcrR family transcriptional regulator [Bradyrhizobium sp. USDA 4537]MCP1985334.1 AcrR family transcriptional regulator [Bradyrhizobium sp. USDA 4539]